MKYNMALPPPLESINAVKARAASEYLPRAKAAWPVRAVAPCFDELEAMVVVCVGLIKSCDKLLLLPRKSNNLQF